MKVWLITVGEPLPVVDENPRLMRTGLLANALVDSGHEVIWWTSTFDHSNKKQRFEEDRVVEISHQYRMKFLHGRAYSNNVSIDRIVDHRRIAAKFSADASKSPEPDIIVCSLPTLELSYQAVKYGKRHGIPVVLDIRDLWPDIFMDRVPVFLKPVMKLFLLPMQRLAFQACRSATAIVGNSPSFVEWGIKNAGRKKTALDKAFPFGYSAIQPDEEEKEKAFAFWEERGIAMDDGVFTVCFFGAVGWYLDLETVIQAAQRVGKRKFRFVFCGSGDRYDEYKNITKNQENIDFPGWLGKAKIWALMQMSSVGLAPYISGTGYTGNLPNKPIEYLSAGLPVLSSVRGYLEELLSVNRCGVTYDNGDVDGLVDILESLSASRARLHELSSNAYSTYQKNFRAEKIYPDMVRYLENVVETGI